MQDCAAPVVVTREPLLSVHVIDQSDPTVEGTSHMERIEALENRGRTKPAATV
jgi:hypothetical protein